MSKSIPTVTTAHEVWYLQVEGSEFGPLTPTEIQTILRNGKLKGEIYAWKSGMEQWKPVSDVTELLKLNAELEMSRMGATNPGNKRKSNRVPFMAVVQYRAAGSDLQNGICRDISPSGMLIVSKARGIAAGQIVSLQVCPVNDRLLPEFEVQARIIRMDASGQAFAVSFADLNAAIASRIDGLVKSSGK